MKTYTHTPSAVHAAAVTALTDKYLSSSCGTLAINCRTRITAARRIDADECRLVDAVAAASKRAGFRKLYV